jgi:hypothetical protein
MNDVHVDFGPLQGTVEQTGDELFQVGFEAITACTLRADGAQVTHRVKPIQCGPARRT